MSRKTKKNCEKPFENGGMTQFAGQEKVGGAWASDFAKCMQCRELRPSLFPFRRKVTILFILSIESILYARKCLLFLSSRFASI